MTTENVLVLFTDMVGSTALASSVAPDAADELRRRHFSVLRQAVAETGGTEVKNLGDGLMVVFAPLARGHASKDVAVQLSITPKTARNYVERVYGKIGVSTRSAATRYATRHGIV